MRDRERLEPLLEKLRIGVKEILGETLAGLYVHGSAAFGCFRWAYSDLDFLIAVKEEPELSVKLSLLAFLLDLEAEAPKKGLEMSMVLETVCRRFVFPTPYVLHYSPLYREACRTAGKETCQRLKGVDADLAAHFTVTRAKGISLFGAPAREFFGEIPWEDYLESVAQDLQDAEARRLKEPASVLLNLCRGAAALKGQILSKEQGGSWALNTLEGLPSSWELLIRKALLEYCQGEKQVYEEQAFLEFCRWVNQQFQIKRKKQTGFV